jgi:hypothetical protein
MVNIPAPACGVNIYQLIQYSRACGSYPDLLDILVAANKDATEPIVPSG